MPEARTLFHRADAETSREAAEKMIKSGTLSRQEKEVLNAIKTYLRRNPLGSGQTWKMERKDFTAKEINYTQRIDYYTIQRRLSGLHCKGLIERVQSGVASVRSGKLIPEKRDGCCVWRLKGE